MADLQRMKVLLIFAFLMGCCSASCPSSSWREYNGYCYRFFPYSKSFNNAERFCEGYGAHLVSVLSATEQRYVYNLWRFFVPANDRRLWIGLEDAEGYNQFRWTDGSCQDYTNWHPGEPSSRGERCAQLWYRRNKSWYGHWNDSLCSGSYPFMCKRRAT